MWISERSARGERRDEGVSVGRVSLGGLKPAVLVGGELRQTELVCPGLCWLPRVGEEVLVLTSGEGDCLVLGGVGGAAGQQLEPGELCLTNGSGGEIRLRPDGTIVLLGRVQLRGALEIEGGLKVNGVHLPQPPII